MKSPNHLPWIAAILLVCATVLWPFVRFDTSLSSLLPTHGKTARTVQFLTVLPLANKLVISFSSTNGVLTTHDHEAIDRFESRLSQALQATAGNERESPAVPTKIAQKFSPDSIAALAQALPLFVPTNRLPERTTESAIRQSVKGNYLRLLRPEGSFLARMIQTDPLGLLTPVLSRLRTLSDLFGYAVRPDPHGRLLHADGRHRLVIMETEASPSDRLASEKLVEALQACCNELPPELQVQVASGHLHTVSNERNTKRDLGIATSLSFLLLLLLVVFLFRDSKILLVPLIPFCALAVAIPFTFLLTGKLAFLSPAFGPILAGLTIDYGIHVYLTRKRGYPIRTLFRPILAGLCTTLAVFLAFFFSSIAAFRQLAFLSCVTVLLSFAGSVFLLPRWIRPRTEEPAHENIPVGQSPRNGLGRRQFLVSIPLFLLALAGVFWVIGKTDYALSLSDLDGADERIRSDEETIRSLWQPDGDDLAIAAFVDHTRTGSLIQTAAFRNRLTESNRNVTNAISYLSFLPSPKGGEESVAEWNAYWRERGESVWDELSGTARGLGFSDTAFRSFEKQIREPVTSCEPPALLAELQRMFCPRTATGESVSLVYLPSLRGEELTAVAETVEAENGHLISMPLLRHQIREIFKHEFVAIGIAALLFLLLAAVPLRHAFFLVYLPTLLGAVGVFTASVVLRHPLNLIHLICLLLVFGICFDYGAFMLNGLEKGTVAETRKAVILCWLTTLCGTAPLLLAKHPVIFAIGFTLTAGITFGCLCSLLLPLLLRHGGNRTRTVIPLLCLTMLGIGCASVPESDHFDPVSKRDIAAPYGEAPPTNTAIQFRSTVTFSIRGRAFTSLCQTEVNVRTKTFRSVGLTPTGLTLFHVSGTNGVAHCEFLAKPLADLHSRLGEWIAQDIDTLFLHPPQVRGKSFYCTTFTPVDGTLYPLFLRLDNKRIGYRLTVINDEIRIRGTPRRVN
ncbi:MAG: hypothetical protein IJR99_09380 [Kiritimatiellae bacterium]|nr:hypothetical protein [Kiritimatiellia bacterium]